MDRRHFLQSLGSAVAGTELLALNTALAAAPEPSASPGPSGGLAFLAAPVLINPASDGVSIVCVFNDRATGWVEYGETAELGHRCEPAGEGLRPVSDHLVFRLSGLQPGKPCYYRVHAAKVEFLAMEYVGSTARRGEEIVSPVRSFRTLDPGAPEISFTVWNDTHETVPTLERLIAMHREQPTDFLFWNGDVVNDIPSKQALLSQYFNPAGQEFAASVPYFFTRGNHDVRGAEARLLPQYLDGPQGAYYYTFRHGPVGCVVLDTGEDKPDNDPDYGGLASFEQYRTAQRQWLARAIEEPAFASAPIRIAFLHIPLVWEAPVPDHWKTIWHGHQGWITEDGSRKWHDLLVKAGIKLVISGHTHRYAWFPAHGDRPYGQLIGGGPKPEAATTISVKANAQELSFEVKDLTGKPVLQGSVSA